MIINPVGNLCKSRILGYGARVCDPQRLDLRGSVLRLTEPRSTFAEISVGVETAYLTITQGGLFLATAGLSAGIPSGFGPMTRTDHAVQL
ncbi:MAG TPA: hypothetical protein VFZ59_11030 [Verrucomicrobiae bacterium]|nr:hypothetical protein [Verrucomicrobiae bacterium]